MHLSLWEHGKVRDLGWPGRDTTTMSGVTDLNNRGQVVGVSFVSARQAHAFLWQDGMLTDIARGRWSVAADINNEGQIAGERGTGKTSHGTRIVHAVIWTWQPTK